MGIGIVATGYGVNNILSDVLSVAKYYGLFDTLNSSMIGKISALDYGFLFFNMSLSIALASNGVLILKRLPRGFVLLRICIIGWFAYEICTDLRIAFLSSYAQEQLKTLYGISLYLLSLIRPLWLPLLLIFLVHPKLVERMK